MDDVGGEVDESRAWAAVPACAVGILDGAGDEVEGGGADSKLGVRGEKGDGVQFLKGAFSDAGGLSRAGED